MTPPLVVVERHRNRKSVPDCDAFQKNAERCKNLTCFALRGTKAATPYRPDALAYSSGRAAPAARSCPRPNEGNAEMFSLRSFALFRREEVQDVCGFLCQRCSCARTSMSRMRAKKA